MGLYCNRLFFAGASAWVILGIILSAPANADLFTYVNKYQSTSVSENAMNRLQRYDYLIDYFTSFSYFEPNHKVSADFVRALILAESSANPRAVSHKEAFGLGQIILTTGQQAGRELYNAKKLFKYVPQASLKNISSEDLFDPAVNILLTCYLIAKYNYKFEGKLELVISAWNAGENTKSLAQGRHAPYIETQNLIGKVNGYYLFLLKNKGALGY